LREKPQKFAVQTPQTSKIEMKRQLKPQKKQNASRDSPNFMGEKVSFTVKHHYNSSEVNQVVLHWL
jgi:hypothetical protein